MELYKKKDLALARFNQCEKQCKLISSAMTIVQLDGALYDTISEEERDKYFENAKRFKFLRDNLETEIKYLQESTLSNSGIIDSVLLEVKELEDCILNLSEMLTNVIGNRYLSTDDRGKIVCNAAQIYRDYLLDHGGKDDRRAKAKQIENLYDGVVRDDLSSNKKMSMRALLHSISLSGNLDAANSNTDDSTSAMLFCQLLNSKM